MSFVREGFQAYTQDYISKSITSSLFGKVPLFYLLTGIGGNHTKSTMKIGRPGVVDTFSGKKMDKIQRENILTGFNSYQPVLHFRNASNTKTMGARDTMPTVSNATTESQDQNVGTSKFNMVRKVEPILVWNETLKRAMNSGPAGLNNKQKAVANVLQNATDEAINTLIDAWATAFWTGSPTNQAADLWDNPAGVTQAIGSTTNTYGNVDRSVAANSQWVPQVVSDARSAVLSSLIDEANLTKGCARYGNGVNVILTTPALYRTFKDEVRAKGQTVLANGMPEMGEYGFKQECLRFDNAYVMYDFHCPTNAVACLNLATWKIIIDAEENFKAEEYVDLKKYVEGGKDAHQSFVQSKLILACEDPYTNCYFSNVT